MTTAPDPACPACGGRLSPWRTVPSSEPALGSARFALQRCGRCGTAITIGEAPQSAHSAGAYGVEVPRLHRLALPVLRAFDRQRLALFSRLVGAGAKLLDVGAGRGRFVLSARSAGYDARGIEPAPRARDAPVVQASIEETELPAGMFDVVTLWHVLEHLDAPRAALRRIHEWIRPDGLLVIGVPNLASAQARLGGERWYHLDVPRHRTHFTPLGLELLLRGCGFEALRSQHVLAEHNPFGMWQSLVNRLTRRPSYLYNLLKRNAPLASGDLLVTVLALPLAPLAALAELAAGALRHGGTVAVVARRVD